MGKCEYELDIMYHGIYVYFLRPNPRQLSMQELQSHGKNSQEDSRLRRLDDAMLGKQTSGSPSLSVNVREVRGLF